jgi:Dolichyl-phosphate-mannose-protein mannosyltransferase
MATRPRRLWLALLVATLCALHAWMAASVSRTFSTTSDEIAHLTAGYTYWTQADYRYQPENGIFPQRWAALPLLWMDIRGPKTEGHDWTHANVWPVGNQFFHEQGNDLPAMLAAGRAMIALLSACLCLVIYCWTRDLFGWKAGLLALVLACFAPELLAHGGLATSDTAASLGFALALLSWWRLLQRVTPGRLLAAGLCAGLLAVSKHSVVLFAPMAVLLGLLRLARAAPLAVQFRRTRLALSGWHRAPAIAGLLGVSALICVGVIWSAYGFRYRAAPAAYADQVGFVLTWPNVLMEDEPAYTGKPEADGEIVDRSPGIVQHFVRLARDHRLLPEAWLFGLSFVEKNSRARLAYFAGEYKRTGWTGFFPVAFVLKTTLPALALVAAGLAAVGFAPPRRRVVWLYRLSPLLILLAVYWTFSLQSKLNIGHRHLLPTYAACYVIAGAALLLARRRRIWLVLPVALAAWHVAESIMIRPDYLAHFNPIAGGPKEAHRVFVDSSLDWGQDLPRLRTWLDDNAGDRKVFLSYFGSGSPAHAGIRAVRLGDGYFDWSPRSTPPRLSGGIYCFNATMFRRVYTHVRGPWTEAYEEKYRHLNEWLGFMARQPKGLPPAQMDGSPLTREQVNSLLLDYEHLMLGRLCHYLQFRDPDARVGYTFLIFRLSDEEISFALKAPLPLLNASLLNEHSQP